ncbi:MAG TPA: diguanylate phosphodiesterase, partial [Firmicutes bacterium]|nr:diguanylate phosphodiesterase [Bacillota bacterium]
MRRKLMNCFIFIIIAVMCVNMSGCIFNKKSEKASADQQPLVINLEGGDWGYPTPYGHYQRGPGIFKMQLLFDSLLQRGEEGLIPWLAEQWEVSSDGKEYIFTLREDVKWHDGQNLTAEDVKFSFSYFAVHPP